MPFLGELCSMINFPFPIHGYYDKQKKIKISNRPGKNPLSAAMAEQKPSLTTQKSETRKRKKPTVIAG
jgi:hypothetical protein